MKLINERSCERLPGLTYHFIIRTIFCVTAVLGGKLHLDGEESEPALLVSHVNALHPARLQLTGGGHVLTYTCARKCLPHLACWSMPSSELTRLRPRIQDSSWMPWWEGVCFQGVSSCQHFLCVYQCWHYRGSSEAVWRRFQIVWALAQWWGQVCKGMRSWATWSSSCSLQRGWTIWPLNVPPNSNNSMVLWDTRVTTYP